MQRNSRGDGNPFAERARRLKSPSVAVDRCGKTAPVASETAFLSSTFRARENIVISRSAGLNRRIVLSRETNRDRSRTLAKSIVYRNSIYINKTLWKTETRYIFYERIQLDFPNGLCRSSSSNSNADYLTINLQNKYCYLASITKFTKKNYENFPKFSNYPERNLFATLSSKSNNCTKLTFPLSPVTPKSS